MHISKPILILIALAIAVLMLFTCNQSNPPQVADDEEPDLEHIEWLTNGGDIVSSLKGEPEAFAKIDHRFADSLAREYKTREKNLLEYIVILESAHVDLPPVAGSDGADYFPPAGDSCPPVIRNIRKQFQNPYYIANVQVGDSPYLHLNRYDTLTAIWKTVKEGNIFNRKTFLQLDLSSADSSNKIYGIKAYRKEEKKKKWAIGIQAGYGYVFIDQKPKRFIYGGIGVTRTIARF